MEYSSLASKHWFLAFRSGKRQELRISAKNHVAERETDFPKYRIAVVFQILLMLSIGFAFWLGVGKGVYTLFENNVDQSESSPIYRNEDYYEGEEWEEYEDVPLSIK